MEKVFSVNNLVLIVFSLVSPLSLAFLLRWGMKNKQFSNPKRSASLPLEGYIPEEGCNPSEPLVKQKESDGNVSL